MNNFSELKELFQKDRFVGGAVLVLGAGINGDDAPKWDEVLTELLQHTLIEIGAAAEKTQSTKQTAALQKEFDSYAQASLVDACLGPDRLVSIVGETIYRNRNKILAKKDGLLAAVAKLCASDRIRAIVSFNYDDYLEQKLEDLIPERTFVAIDCLAAEASQYAKDHKSGNSLPIYHVHGFIPQPGRTLQNSHGRVVLSQASYISLFGHFESSANYTPLHLLRSYQAIFIGCSLRDWNMIRLLQISGQRGELFHYCITRILERKSLSSKNAYLVDRLRARLWETLGIKPIYCDNFEQIAAYVKELSVPPGHRLGAKRNK